MKKHNKTQKIEAKEIYIGNLNENITNEDFYELFRLKTSEYLCQTSSVDLKCLKKQKKCFGFVTVPECLDSPYRAKWC